MTSFAFILGCVPLWTATGSGSSARRILGTVVISGMLAATLIAVFLIPLLFVVFERIALRLGAKVHVAHTATPTPAEGA
jgi:HAE1 family hydrophobic/amphiphilic exporter-1